MSQERKTKEFIQNDNVGGTSPTITSACVFTHAAVGFKVKSEITFA